MTKKLDQYEFIKRCKNKHGNKYDYSKSIYNGKDAKVDIICPIHGQFSQSAAIHFKGSGCPKCANINISINNKLSTDTFINKAQKVHGNRYDYSESEYTGAERKIKIKCFKHGIFEQLASNHLRGHGCRLCRNEQTKINYTKSHDDFIKQAKLKHKGYYSYELSNYIDCYTPIAITCPKHGVFYQKPTGHLSGRGCELCGNDRVSDSRSGDTETFIKKANKVHENKYDYSLTEFTGSRNKVVIKCPVHGEFIQTAMNHVSGCGCQKCALEDDNYLKDGWIRRSKNKIGIFYIIHCFNSSESFYKYGITFNTLKYRYKRPKDMPYNYEIARLIMSTDKGYIWDLEKRFGKIKKKNKYLPKIPFAGSKNECFIKQ